MFIIIFAIVLVLGSGCGAVLTVFVDFIDSAANNLIKEPETTIEDVADHLDYWDIELPDDCKLLCATSDIGFPNDGERYYMIGFENEPSEIITDFSDKCDDFVENRFFGSLEYLVSKKGIAEEFIADSTEDYVWKYNESSDHDLIFFLYFPTEKIYVFCKY